MIRPVDVLLEYLHAQQARGMSHLYLDQDARKGLRLLSDSLRGKKISLGQGTLPVVATAATAAAATHDALRVLSLDELTVGVDAVSASGREAAMPRLLIAGVSRVEKLESLRRQAESWGAARALGSLREVMVFATGSPEARIMLIGEAPGHEEEKKLEPFVGPAGQQLDKILKTMGLERGDVYLTNIVKFRPATARQSTNNRPPTSEEIAVCLPLLREEINILEPACIIALGGSAAEGLLGPGSSVSSLRGAWHDYAGVPVRVTYHPSYLLRSKEDTRTRRMVWEDMLAVMEKTGLPINAKQRGYFLPKH